MQNSAYENDRKKSSNLIGILSKETIAHQIEMLNDKISNASKHPRNFQTYPIEIDEDDLILAAKLGKALLAKNEELTSEHCTLMGKVEVRKHQFYNKHNFVF